ncbi:MAG: hydantoinase B/oxoprolinase family protein [Nitrospinota bacterium]
MSRLDPVTMELIRNAVLAAAEEMRFIVMRSARAPLLKEAGDLSCVLTDGQGRLIAQGKDIPVHLGVMAFTVKEFLKRVSAQELHPGDVYLTNLPEIGGNHLPDVKAIRPVFLEGEVVAFAVCLAHWPDTGGALPGSYVPDAAETYQEGLRIPPVRIFQADRLVRETLDFILENVRGREEREGDILGQYASQTVAETRLLDIFGQWGRGTVLAAFQRMQEESEIRMRRAVTAIPDGVYEGEDSMDPFAEGEDPLPIRVTIRIRGDEAEFDFSGTAPPAPFPINTTPFIAAASVFYSMKVLVGEGIPMNDGCCRPLILHVPEDTLLNPGREAARVGGNHETSQRVVDAVFRALAPVLPDRITAGGPTTSGLTLFSGRRADGSTFILYEVHAGGEGAAAHRDGSHATRVHMSNVMNTPIESLEAEYPMRVESYSLRDGSGGAGGRRGGLGVRRRYRMLAPEARVTTMLEREQIPPWGAFGGESGETFRVTLNPGKNGRRIKGKETVSLAQGDVVLVESSGGGGYGPPEEAPGPEGSSKG